MLVDAGYIGPSLAVSRTVIELDIDIAYILHSRANPTALAGVLMSFWALLEVAHLNRLQLAKDLRLDAFAAAPADALKRRKALLAEYPALNKKKWASDELEVRAKRTKRDASYRWAYDVASGHVHSGPEALAASTNQSRETATMAVALVAMGMAQLTQEVSNYLQLGYGSQCREVVEQVRDFSRRRTHQNGTSSD